MSIRKIFFWLHLTAGCVGGLVIAVMSVTGAMLAFERPVKAHLDTPVVLQGGVDASQRLPLDSLLGLLKSSGQGMPSELVLRSQEGAPIEARYGRIGTLYLNPWTAEIVGQPSEGAEHFFGAVERVHRSLGLGMQSRFGRGIMDAGNLVFLFLLLSGLYLWLPKVWKAVSFRNRVLFRGGLQGRAREWNWHNVIGIWTAVPLLFIVVTGVVISYPWASNLLFRMTGSQPPARGFRGDQRPRHGDNGDGGPAIQSAPLSSIAEAAEEQVPGWKAITIQMPEAQDRMVNVSVDTSVGGQPEKVTQVVIDRQSGLIRSVKHFRDNSLGSRLRAWARFTHTGEEFGLAGEMIAAMCCLGAVVMVWTGIAMAIRRGLGWVGKRDANLPEKRRQTVSV